MHAYICVLLCVHVDLVCMNILHSFKCRCVGHPRQLYIMLMYVCVGNHMHACHRSRARCMNMWIMIAHKYFSTHFRSVIHTCVCTSVLCTYRCIVMCIFSCYSGMCILKCPSPSATCHSTIHTSFKKIKV